MSEGNELDSTCGISDEELTERFKESIRIDQEICKVKDEYKRQVLWFSMGISFRCKLSSITIITYLFTCLLYTSRCV